ncbi:zinc metalloprotease HtpX [Stygiolobus azoricus]|uniref:Protease HtpX homolog n=1 Tax=Stygiolobus azoricus TaxID=41675 RepID=A0A650CMN1_9CREN|nr:zinc metalloprotease HtpX [Stygiolobus azoricus]QGR19111.1 M48 family metalloprotease [Stygiolobus azoricus]
METLPELRFKIYLSLVLTIISEAIVTYILLQLLNFPVIAIIPFLGLFWLIQWLISPYLVARDSFEITEDHPYYGRVYEMVKRIAIASGIKPPRVFIVNAPYPNAFAYGNYVTGKRIGITRPLLNILSEEELAAVIGHEVGHIKHNDVEIGMAIGLIPSVLGFVSNLLLNLGWVSLIFAVDETDLFLGIVMLAIGGALFIITLGLQLFVLWFNRLRESYADFHAVQLFGKDAINLVNALAKIEIYMQNIRLDPFTGIIVTAPPVKVKETDPSILVEEWLNEKPSPFSDILATHPDPAKRAQMIYKSVIRA